MKYRSDIDGLRAIAVLSVLLSHSGLSVFEGGAIGVDVFFVISGFLITSILIREKTSGNWSLLGFYERRARRILPALLFVILAVTPFSWYLMLPDYLQNYGQSVVATLLFSNNILLALTGGYWELDSAFKPLLHTWSLGVEEQFYIAFPILFLVIWKSGKRMQVTVIVMLSLLSLAVAEHGWRHYPNQNFYLPTSRAWELLVGCATAYTNRESRPWHGVAGLFGLVSIILAVFVFSKSTPAPSLWIAWPVLATSLVLACSQPGSVTWKILSLPPLVLIGLISYSTYLWHQPLFALARVASLEPPPVALMLALVLLALSLGWLSWRFIEQPFRKPGVVSKGTLVLSTGGLSVLFIAGGVFLHVSQGLPKRIFPNIENVGTVNISYNERIRNYTGEGFSTAIHPRILIIGDSFARDIANTVKEIEEPADGSFAYAEDDIQSIISENFATSTVDLLGQADLVLLATAHRNANEIIAAFNILKGMTLGRVILIGPKNFGANINPYARVPVNQRAAVRSKALIEFIELNEMLRVRLPSSQYVDIMSLLGEDGRHVAVFDDGGNPLTPDRMHLTRYGAVFLAGRLMEKRADFVDLLH